MSRILQKEFLLALVALLAIGGNTFAQQDSLYYKLHKASEKRTFTRLLYNLIFVPPQEKEYPLRPEQSQGEIINPYITHEGKTISKVVIEVSDPFTHQDSSRMTALEKLGNKSHIATKKWIVSNKLLFKEGDTLMALRLSESERLLRQASFSTDAKIEVEEIDSGHVLVRVFVHDKWSIIAPIELTANEGNITLRDQNFLGLGQQFEQYAGYTPTQPYRFSGSYTLSNIDNTYISAQASYQTTQTGTFTGLSFDRPFFSPFAQWAGGISMSHKQQFYQPKTITDATPKEYNVTNATLDVWSGRALKILRDGSWFKQSHNLVLTGRYFTNHFLKRSDEARDLLASNNNTAAFVGGIAFAVQQYYKDKFIYRFGANEDVPTGLIIQLTYGVLKKEFVLPRYYSGLEIARAKHLSFGYLTATVAGGVFFNNTYTNDVSGNFKLYYISNLVKTDGWYIRQFVNYNLVSGMHKFYDEKVSLTGSDLYGFDGSGLNGHTKMVADFETVAYAPYNILGFKLAPVLMAGYGMIDASRPLLRSTIYQAYSLGLMFRNENLLNSTFQVSFGVYPYFPNGQTYILKYNPVTSFTIRVRAFGVGRPDFVGY